ncbi:MAG: tRNA pseudouridine(13) synthase TruD [Polyangiales bacterium]
MNAHSPLPEVTFKASPEDFVVDEIDAYPACSEGEHTFVRIRKRGLTTDGAARAIAAALGIDGRAIGWAGMKDRHAVATQRLSLHGTSPEAVAAMPPIDGLEIVEVLRHKNKLKPGHLHGNRFTIRLHAVPEDAREAIDAGLAKIAERGAPNYFGPQRFGRDGDNAERALAFVRGETRPPRDARERRLLFSALQSRWFNAVLAARVADDTFDVPQLGDLLQKIPTGGLFTCEDVETDRARAQRFEISPTGPMFGVKMATPGEAIAARELETLAADAITSEQLRAHRDLGEGTRRSLRLVVGDLHQEWGSPT